MLFRRFEYIPVRIRVEVTKPTESESFTLPFLRSLYNRFDEDRDGRLGFQEVC